MPFVVGTQTMSGPPGQTSPATMAPQAGGAGSSLTTHTVVNGETLSGIASLYYGDPALWRTIADANGVQILLFDTVTSAVNYLTIANAATSGAPTLAAAGSDTNININLTPKGTGAVVVSTAVTPTGGVNAAGGIFGQSRQSSSAKESCGFRKALVVAWKLKMLCILSQMSHRK